MNDANPTPESDLVADGLAKRMFLLTLLGVVVYVGAIIALISSGG